ncbi:hypothetical protein [Nonomuraea longicatena]|uniref:FtsK domain-containing protein n=1 Tax=Nonomuraea longicatena TaxID=83682 RepID=A0ABP4A791_9ACTN
MGSTTTGTPRADWSVRPRGAAGATVQGALALAAVAAVGDTAALDPLWGGAVAAVGALGTVVVGAHRHHPPAALLYRIGCWLSGGGWLTYTLAATPWSLNTLAALGVGSLAAGLLAPFGRATPTPGRQPGTGLMLRASARNAAEWEARLLRVCRIRATVTDVRPWPGGTGYDVHADLPGGGVTRRQLTGYAEGLATDARLPEGCGVEVAAGAHRGAVVLRVSTVNQLARTIDYPADYSPRSVLEPVSFGEHANGEPAAALLREDSVLASGKRGSGKTTLLQDLSIALGRCLDNLVWHLDLNGGGLTQPWIDVWLEGRTVRCPIDWAAPNPAEGKRMLAAAVAIAKHRKASYRALKRSRNTNLLPVSVELPQITIVVDEGAQAVADRDLKELLNELQNIGRNEAVNMVVSALRPTSDLIPVNMRKQSGVRVQMYGPDTEELGHMFGWAIGGKLSMDQLAGRGTGFVSIDGSAPRPFRAYNALPGQIEQAALAIAATRPDLDPASAHAAGSAYATRYERMRWAFTDHDTDDDTDTEYGDAEDGAAPAFPATATAAAGRHLTALPGGADTWADPVSLAHRTTQHGSAAAWAAPGHAVTAAAPPRQIPAPARPVPPIVGLALDAFTAAETGRLHSTELAEALGMSLTELADALRPHGITPRENPFKRGGVRARGYALEDFQHPSGGSHPGSHPGVTPGHTAV